MRGGGHEIELWGEGCQKIQPISPIIFSTIALLLIPDRTICCGGYKTIHVLQYSIPIFQEVNPMTLNVNQPTLIG